MTPAVAMERRLRRRNCGVTFASKAADRPCPKPSPGREYVDCGKGRHMFSPPTPRPRKPPLTPVQRERRRCARIAAAHEETYRHLADKASAAGDRAHELNCLARVWCAEEIRRAVEKGTRAK